VARIDAAAEAMVMSFVPNPPLPPEKIIRFIQSRRDVKLSGPDRLRFTLKTVDLAQRVQRLREILKALSS
jgi:transcription-repair coupling factor (superfamily II helicase)